MVKFLVVDDHLAVREGTKTILESIQDFDVMVLTPPYSPKTVKDFDFSEIDIILMDLNLGEEDFNGIQFSKEILKHHKEAKIILYTGYDVEDYWDEAIDIGIYGVINKSEDKEVILDYIKHVLDGKILVDFRKFQQLKKKAEDNNANHRKVQNGELTEREKLILAEVEKGLTNQEIADKLHLSKRSIEYSLTNIYHKLGINTRTEAVLIAKSEGYID